MTRNPNRLFYIKTMKTLHPFLAIGVLCFLAGQQVFGAPYLSPVALAPGRDGKALYISDATGKRVTIFDIGTSKVAGAISLSQTPADLVFAPNGTHLYVAGAEPQGQIHVIDVARRRVVNRLPAGHTPTAVAVSPDGAKLYVSNRFNNNIGVYDLKSGKEVSRIPVPREPVALAVTPDGKTVFVANLLPTAPATSNYVAAVVSVIDTDSNKVVADLSLPDGSMSLRGVCVSPCGKYAYVTHILAHYQLPTTQLERGWMCTAGLTIIDVMERKVVNTVLLDEVEMGAANPWGVVCTADGKYLCVTHSGSHELSIIDRVALHERLAKAAAGTKVTEVTGSYSDVPSDLTFLVGIRRRIRLPGNSPRGVAIAGGKVYAAEYFTGTLAAVDIDPAATTRPQSLSLGRQPDMTVVRRGEMIFHDAERCFQKWQSCVSCHPDIRVDGLNWDLLNDGIGNPKNTKNMLYTHKTPPSMSLSVREGAEAAVRSGFKFIQFALPPEEESKAVDEFLKALTPVPSPHLVRGDLSPSARRGRNVFRKANCGDCHSGPYFTNLREYDIGTGIGPDKGRAFDTPGLNELWRTAPYLHDGRAATVMEVLTTFNPGDRHGKTSNLSKQELDDLVEYLLSL
ncbi:MAG: cell surface protein [Verrucomicrobia bacterium]|nr:cell surface protein [Verrucomicrobiota bacterium]